MGFTIRCTPASYQKLHQPTTSSVYELARCVVVQQRRQTIRVYVQLNKPFLKRQTTITMAYEIVYKKFMTAASGWYKRSVAKELNVYGALVLNIPQIVNRIGCVAVVVAVVGGGQDGLLQQLNF